MSIIITKQGDKPQKLNPTNFEYENDLQEYIFQNPDTLPIYEIDENKRLLIVCREFPTNSGPIDAIGIDQDGEVYLVETKLYKNADKRKVIAQVLDYGASLHFQKSKSTYFFEIIESQIQARFKMSFSEKVNDFFGGEISDSNQIIEKIEQNFEEGIFKFIVLMDSIEDRLKDLIKYLNQNSKFDIYGVEMQYYKIENYEIVIPKLFGAEISKEIKTTSKSLSRTWDENSFFEEGLKNLTPENFQKIKLIYEVGKQKADIVSWGKGQYHGSFQLTFKEIGRLPILFIENKTYVWFYFGYVDDEKKREELKSLAQSIGISVPKNNFGIRIENVDSEKIVAFIERL